MTRGLLIDADVFADYLMGEPHAREFFEQLPEGTFHYSALTRIELLSAGPCSDSGIRSSTAALLSIGRKADIDEAIISLAADLKREHKLTIPDAVIAATALHLKAELITKNVNRFKRINGLLLMKPY